MQKIKQNILQLIGVAGSVVCLVVYIRQPSFPTPDKLIIFLIFVFMIFKQATDMLKRLLPLVVLILVYESFRSVADKLNSHVNYGFSPHMDRLLFGNLPTVYFQNWLWRGHVQWYDILLYIPYMLFFVAPLGLAILVWKTKDQYYWQVITTYLLVFFSAFLTFLAFPAAPPWMASQNHYIQPITRISSNVWATLGIHNFPSLYNQIAPNQVAAFPSLHAACGALLSMLVFKIYGRKWGCLSLIYPVLLCFGVIYEGEHYAFDVIAGLFYAAVGYLAAPYLMRWGLPRVKKLIELCSSSTKSVLKSAR